MKEISNLQLTSPEALLEMGSARKCGEMRRRSRNVGRDGWHEKEREDEINAQRTPMAGSLPS